MDVNGLKNESQYLYDSHSCYVKNFNIYVGSEVLTALVMKSTIFWDIMPCSPLSVNRRFEGTYRLHLQGQKIS
jgi:hypothetical protein